MESIGPTAWLTAGGGMLGLVFGAVVQRTHFCTMGALADFYLFGGLRRLRSWLLAISTAMLLTQLLAGTGVVDLTSTAYLAPRLGWLAAIIGGAMFGFGMVLAGGCASRNLVRLAGGSLKSLVVVLVMGVAAYATMLGVLAPLHALLRESASVTLQTPTQDLPTVLAGMTGLAGGIVHATVIMAVGAGLLAWCLKGGELLRSPPDLAAGLVLGCLVPAGWLVTGWLAQDELAPIVPASLTYVGPTAQSLLYVMTGMGGNLFNLSLIAGTLAGAALVAWIEGRLRLEGFTAVDDLARHVTGGALMGAGGVLALGCTIGQGLTGLSTLAVGSVLATGSIVAGAGWAFHWLQTGQLLPAWPWVRVVSLRIGGSRSAPAAAGSDDAPSLR